MLNPSAARDAEQIVIQWLEDNFLHACDPPWYGPDDAPSYLESKYLSSLENGIAEAITRTRQVVLEETRQRSADLLVACRTALQFIYDCETGVNGVEQAANRTIDVLEAAIRQAGKEGG